MLNFTTVLSSLRLSERLGGSLLLSFLPASIILLLLSLRLTGVRLRLVRLFDLLLLRLSQFIFCLLYSSHAADE